jgi:hypothetical protein
MQSYARGGYKYVYTHIQEYLLFQLQTVDSGFDLAWLSKTNTNVVEYLVDFFYLHFTSFLIQYGANVCFFLSLSLTVILTVYLDFVACQNPISSQHQEGQTIFCEMCNYLFHRSVCNLRDIRIP